MIIGIPNKINVMNISTVRTKTKYSQVHLERGAKFMGEPNVLGQLR